MSWYNSKEKARETELMTYKEDQEAFVSNLNGTTPYEVFLISAALPPLCNFVHFALLSRSVTPKQTWVKHGLEFATLVLPVLLFFTVLSGISSWIGAVLPLLLARAFLAAPTLLPHAAPVVKSGATLTAQVSSAITAFRAYVNIATAIAILGVDFTIFPRRYAKVETFGTGLMDVGVGLYVFSMALVSREARQQPGESLLRGWKTIAALLVLGTGRLVTTKAAAYQEHVSEYGVHWNFFFTLATLKLFTLLVSAMWQTRPSHQTQLGFWSPLISATAVGIGYQGLLQACSVSDFIQHSWSGTGGRSDFISANREGIFSCLGYLALYCAAVQLGRCLWTTERRFECLVSFWLVPMCLLIGLLQMEIAEPISRRMANLPFVLWQIQHGSAALLGFYWLYQTFQAKGHVQDTDPTPKGGSSVEPVLPPQPPDLLSAISQNQLLFFLAANLATGSVNMAIQTIHAPEVLAFSVLATYMAGLCILALVLYNRR